MRNLIKGIFMIIWGLPLMVVGLPFMLLSFVEVLASSDYPDFGETVGGKAFTWIMSPLDFIKNL